MRQRNNLGCPGKSCGCRDRGSDHPIKSGYAKPDAANYLTTQSQPTASNQGQASVTQTVQPSGYNKKAIVQPAAPPEIIVYQTKCPPVKKDDHILYFSGIGFLLLLLLLGKEDKDEGTKK
jgi:hypothetical protein